MSLGIWKLATICTSGCSKLTKKSTLAISELLEIEVFIKFTMKSEFIVLLGLG
jgi:hypothetical protein